MHSLKLKNDFFLNIVILIQQGTNMIKSDMQITSAYKKSFH